MNGKKFAKRLRCFVLSVFRLPTENRLIRGMNMGQEQDCYLVEILRDEWSHAF